MILDELACRFGRSAIPMPIPSKTATWRNWSSAGSIEVVGRDPRLDDLHGAKAYWKPQSESAPSLHLPLYAVDIST
jgi:hypothetical protein